MFNLIPEIIGFALPSSVIGTLIGVAIAKRQNRNFNPRKSQLAACFLLAWAAGSAGIIFGNIVRIIITGTSDIPGEYAIWFAMLGAILVAWYLYTKFATFNTTSSE